MSVEADYFSYSLSTKTYTNLDTGVNPLVDSILTENGDSCECGGALYEIAYTVTVQKEEKNAVIKTPYLAITKVSAKVVVLSEPLKSTCAGSASFPQKYSVKFVSADTTAI